MGWISSVKPVVDRHVGEFDQRVDELLAGAAELDGVIEPAEDARSVFHRFLVADLRIVRTQIGDFCPLVMRSDLERAARTR